MPQEPIELSREDMLLPDFHFKEVEALYFNDLTIPSELYDVIAQKDRGPLIEDLEKVLRHSIEKIDIFLALKVEAKHTYAPWHSLFILKDLEATEALTGVLYFLLQDEDIIDFYLGDGLSEFGWELLYTLANNELPLLVALFKTLTDELDLRKEVIETLKQICLHQPERKMEVQGHLRTMLLYTSTIDMMDEVYIDEVAESLLEAIGDLQLTSLFPKIEKLFIEDKIPGLYLINWNTFEQRYVLFLPSEMPEPTELRTREEIYDDCLILFNNSDEDDDTDELEDFEDYLNQMDEEDAYDDMLEEFERKNEEGKSSSYLNYQEVQTPFVKKEPDVGRNEPCPCGSGKKFKKCCGKN